MKGLVLYHSHSGSTECYARWIAEATGFDCRQLKKAGNYKDYDVVIVGSYILAGQSKAAGWIKSHWAKLQNKKVVYFTTSGALKEDTMLQQIYQKTLPEPIREKLRYFPLNGKMIFADMRPFDRKLMQFAIKMTAKENPEEAKKMAEEYNRVRREDLKPLLDSIKS